tara:strand:- start:15 stop:407 length:393 start_codon:yes stop_codon:yes gene_type:complete
LLIFFFEVGSNTNEKLLNNVLIIIPKRTGIVTIKNICKAISPILNDLTKDVSIKTLIDTNIISGIVKTQSKLIIAVKDTDRATSPLAKEVIMFDVAPPGAAAISITPIDNSGDKGHNSTINKPTKGKITI